MNARRIALITICLALLGIDALPARAAPEPCTCRNGNGCYHYLNAPVSPPDDPCNCPQCRAMPGTCPKRYPKGWDRACAANSKMECFLRRHAASWRLSCSERLDGDCACDNPHPEFCPQCGSHGEEWDKSGMDIIRRQVEIEENLLGPRKRWVLIKSPHFYLLTDIPRLKIRTQSGSFRTMRTHEIAHLFIQRAEIAYEDFCRYVGRPTLQTPMAIFLPRRSSTMEDIQAAYFGSPRTNIIYGGGSKSISGGYPGNGFATSLQKSGDDYGLHLQVRHSVGHILMSCWLKVNGQDKYLPKWVYAGVGHWLARLPEKFREMATFCANEGQAVQNNGRNWRMKLLKIAGGSRTVPIQRLFDTNAMSGLDLDMHIRAWSYFDVYMEEDRERFVSFLRGLRNGTDHRVALQEAFHCTPEEFDRRWKERILGRRGSVAPTPEELDDSDPSRPGARERALIRTERDVVTLAAKIRSLQAVNDPLTAATVVPMLKTDSELVRETIVLVLSKSTSPEVKRWLRTQGLSEHRGIARAYVARVIGDLRDEEAGEDLLGCADDGVWLVRAHVARALGLIRYEPALPMLKEMVDDKAQKVRIAAMDAIASFGEKAGSAWVQVKENLGARYWQVRSAAADCLGDLGAMDAVEPLIDRMEIESGRIRKDIREALKKITRDDLGNNPKYWREWWEKEKERHGGGIPPRGEPPKEPPKGDIEYGVQPTYYGLQVFSEGVGYVLDVSSSMNSTIKVDPGWIKRNRRDYPPRATKFDLALNEIGASIAGLDPRVRFNLYFFRQNAFSWKNDMVPANRSNTDSAVNRMRSEEPRDPPPGKRTSANRYQTNYVDVFRLLLGIEEGDDLTGGFRDTPDTIYFLTDGTPTTGDITDPVILNSWFRELNRFARVKVNVITFGNLGVDNEFLRSLAVDNGGVFVQVPAVK